jgi:predicted GIY-YIG superfamily endonuclease
MTLLSRLRDYRHARSTLESVPIYCVLGDTVLASIAQTRPLTMQALLAVRGLTPDKCTEYGSDILGLVRGSPLDPPPPPPDRVMMRHGNGSRYYRRTGSGKRELLGSLFPTTGFRAAREKKPLATAPDPVRHSKRAKEDDSIYVLQLAQGRVYVGRTSDWRKRFEQHMSGRGSAFTQAYAPTGVVLPRLGRVTGSAEAAERDETLRYMHLRGINLVRGWKYTRVAMSDEERRDAEANIRELFDFCRRCGCPGHFVTRCKATVDRFGQPLGV